MSSFLELFVQGISQEARYFINVMIMDAPLQVLILNGIWKEFLEYLSFDYGENVSFVNITRRKCTPNHAGVKYFHLLPGFRECPILGYKFDGVSPLLVDQPELGVCRDLKKKEGNLFSLHTDPTTKLSIWVPLKI